MPELPEVEITRRGLEEHMVGATILDIVVRNPKLRWPIPDLPVLGRVIKSLKRRAKYLLLDCGNGTLILHLGMSGSLRILPSGTLAALPARGMSGVSPQLRCDPPAIHDHFDLILNNGKLMRLRDPRRFGAVLWHEGDIHTHPLLASLGPEPLEENFHARYLHQALRGRTIAIKQAIMDNHLVVGVGNIYANESLFRSGIKPTLAAGKLSLARCEKLVIEIRATLLASIAKGGSTLRDFVHSDGSSGYFQQAYFVYGRTNEPCRTCGAKILQIKQGQRSSFYCGVCQH
ncbi:MAG: bifunctional DNA-formamidopyrimidine glycosylase/DNA-(apurinic or apyrimidinic site) lyase [Sideroxydans sp.]|nr:bifunctional DNA-formamidopyrimidine glycosylase/DNA-(apurinic or apyrimidinic site) lyase [Sideroxydans sp.]